MCIQNEISSVPTLHGIVFGEELRVLRSESRWKILCVGFNSISISSANDSRPGTLQWCAMLNSNLCRIKLLHSVRMRNYHPLIRNRNALLLESIAPPLHYYRTNSQIGFRFTDREIFHLEMNGERHNRILKSALFTTVAPLHRHYRRNAESIAFDENGCTTVKCVHVWYLMHRENFQNYSTFVVLFEHNFKISISAHKIEIAYSAICPQLCTCEYAYVCIALHISVSIPEVKETVTSGPNHSGGTRSLEVPPYNVENIWIIVSQRRN